MLFYNFGYFYRHPAQVILPFTWDHGFQFAGLAGMCVFLFLVLWILRKAFVPKGFFLAAYLIGYGMGLVLGGASAIRFVGGEAIGFIGVLQAGAGAFCAGRGLLRYRSMKRRMEHIEPDSPLS